MWCSEAASRRATAVIFELNSGRNGTEAAWAGLQEGVGSRGLREAALGVCKGLKEDAGGRWQ